MSNKKKPKKLRTPNVSAAVAAPTAPALVTQARGGQELAGAARLSRSAPVPARTAPAAQAAFDYTYVRKDLTRIGILAGSFIVALVVLSFFIH